MSKNLVYAGIAVLAIIAVILGYKIYQQQTTLNTQRVSSTLPATQQTSLEVEDLLEAALLATSSAAEKNAYYQKLQQLAQDTDLIEITDCKLSPTVVRVKDYASIRVKNNDDVDRVIFYDGPGLKIPSEIKVPTQDKASDISFVTGPVDQYVSLKCVGGSSGFLIK